MTDSEFAGKIFGAVFIVACVGFIVMAGGLIVIGATHQEEHRKHLEAPD